MLARPAREQLRAASSSVPDDVLEAQQHALEWVSGRSWAAALPGDASVHALLQEQQHRMPIEWPCWTQQMRRIGRLVLAPLACCTCCIFV